MIWANQYRQLRIEGKNLLSSRVNRTVQCFFHLFADRVEAQQWGVGDAQKKSVRGHACPKFVEKTEPMALSSASLA